MAVANSQGCQYSQAAQHGTSTQLALIKKKNLAIVIIVSNQEAVPTA